MEFGPRALGARSIIGDARSEKMQSVMNLKIKFRESFRPFAPLVLQEEVDKYFEMRPREDSPYMLQVAPVREELRCPLRRGSRAGLRHRQAATTSARHCRPSPMSTIRPGCKRSIAYATRCFTSLLTRFYEKTGCPVLINTSFNVRSEPIVCTPEDAYRCLLMTDMDVLVMGRQIILREEQPQIAEEDKPSIWPSFNSTNSPTVARMALVDVSGSPRIGSCGNLA